MKFKNNIRLYTWVEFGIWFIILTICICGYRIYNYKKIQKLPSYQIFLSDAYGMIAGSPVKYMGVQIGYVKNIKIMSDSVYVHFVITQKDIELPKGVVATVEFNGLGGSKSLELYPPQDNDTDKVIVTLSPTRISDTVGRLYTMVEKVDSIWSRITHFGGEMGVITNNEIEINPDNIGQTINAADKCLDEINKKRKNFIEKSERILK